MKTEDAKNVQQEPAFSFDWALKGERLEREGEPWLLGRDVRYEFTVHTLNQDGNPTGGIKYQLKLNTDLFSTYRFSISRINEDVVSTTKGDTFAIFASLRDNAANADDTNFTFEISLESEGGGVVKEISFAMGRLAQWSLFSVGEEKSSYYTFAATSSWAGEGNAGYWDWDRILVGWCDISIPALNLEVKGSAADYAEDGGLRLYHRVNKALFKDLAGTDVEVNYGSAFSKNGYTGTLPHTHVFQLPGS
jgi:hypothetical protein